MGKHIDTGSMIIIILTFLLFIVALWVKGLTRDLLLEIGVLLISIKIIMMSYKSSKNSEEVMKELKSIKNRLECKDKGYTNTD